MPKAKLQISITTPGMNFSDQILFVLFQEKDSGLYLTVSELGEYLHEVYGIPGSNKQIRKALENLSKLKRIIVQKRQGKLSYKISIYGIEHLQKKSGPLEVIYVAGSRPFSDRVHLADLHSKLGRGPFFIVDPYYGTQSLAFLEKLSEKGKVNFLTSVPASGERVSLLNQEARALINQSKGKIEIRIVSRRNLHDRYITTPDCLILIGHGLSHFGSKESFIVFVDKHHSAGILTTLSTEFRKKWSFASSF